jgi:putative peptidoglycan lipid II flippase
MAGIMKENSRVTKVAGIVGSATLLSRIFGFLRDVVIAGYFGAGLASDAFFVAFRIPNLLRRLFAEGSLTIAFIPVFTEYLSNKGEDEAFELAGAAIRMLSVVLAAAAVIGMVIAPLIVHVIAPGFAASPEKYRLTVALTRMMFPYIFFIGLVALFMGILNVLDHFAAPALAPVFLNLAMIASVLFLSPHLAEPVFGLAVGVLVGGVLQLVLQLPFLVRKGLRFWKKASLFHTGLIKIGRLMAPAVFGAAVYQINIFISTLLASFLSQGSVSYLYYADRMVQFPLGIFAIATATAVLPSLSRQAAARDYDALRDTFAHAMRLVLFITVPSMVGLIILRVPIIELLFKRGAFDMNTARMTAVALLYYAIGLWAFSSVRIVVSLYYALQDARTPVQMAVISVMVNIGLGILLMGPLQHGGLALATSVASMVNLSLLIWALRKKIGFLGWRNFVFSTLKTLLCSTVMGLAVHACVTIMLQPHFTEYWRLCIGLIVSILAGILSYGACSLAVKSPEMVSLLHALRKIAAGKPKPGVLR